MATGSHRVVVRAWASNGTNGSATANITVGQAAVAVAISPVNAAVQTGLSQQFTASVTGTTNTGVTWWVNGIQGGSSSVGTISTTGLYKAPSSVPTGGVVTIAAKSAANTTKSANATVTVLAAPTPVAVQLTPTGATVQSGSTQQFTATVTGTTNTGVSWSVNGVAGGNSSVGTVSTTGLYTAPAAVPTGGTVTLTAKSTYDSSASANANITVGAATTPVVVAISPTSASVPTGAGKQFTATVSGTANTSVTWLVNGLQGGNSTTGTISANGYYTAPPALPTGSVTVTARSAFDTTKSASSAVTVTASAANHYYVSTTGSDSNNGSQASPWRTMQHAADSATLGPGGAVIHVAAGTYNDRHYCTLPSSSSYALVCVSKSGTASQPIIFQSDQKWQAKLRCGTSSNPMFLIVASHIQIVGFDMSCPAGKFAAGVYGNNSHVQYLNNYLHDFDVSACTSVGVLNDNINAPDGGNNIGHHVASGNVIRHAGAVAGAPNNCNQEHGIYFQAPYDVMTNNLISGIIGWGIHAYGSGICHQVISNNVVFDNSQGGIRIENVTARGGRYWDQCANGGIADYNTVTNNIVVNNGYGQNYTGAGGGIDATGMGTGGSHNVYSNNLLYGNHAYQMKLASPDFSANQFTGTNSSVFLNYQPDKNWAPLTSFNYLNYAPPIGSPAIDNGTGSCAPGVTGCAPKTDVIGAPRPKGMSFDIGAFEFVP